MKFELFLIMGSLSQASHLGLHLRFFSLHVTFHSVMGYCTRVQKRNSNKLKIAAFCRLILFLLMIRVRRLLCVSRTCVCVIFSVLVVGGIVSFLFLALSFGLTIQDRLHGVLA